MSESYLDNARALNELRGQAEASDADLAAHFSLYGRERRIEILRSIDRDLSEPDGDLRKITDDWRTREQLGRAHDTLLRANR
ncbi:hypothetical protein ACVMAJ_007454 [Bradyrhizobium sp. USDA 4448]